MTRKLFTVMSVPRYPPAVGKKRKMLRKIGKTTIRGTRFQRPQMRKTIRSTMSHQAERPSIAPNAVDYQGLLHYQLMGLMRMLLKTSALQSVHSSMASTQQLEKQASACVEEELKSYLHKLESMPNNNNRESNL